MWILIVNGAYDWADGGYGYDPRRLIARVVGLPWGVRRLGHEVHVTTTGKLGPTAERLERVGYDVDFGRYDGIILNGREAWEELERRGRADDLRAHGNVVAFVCAPHDIVGATRYAHTVGLHSRQAVEACAAFRTPDGQPLGNPVFVRWGVTEMPADLPDPWAGRPHGLPRVVFAGAVYPSYLPTLRALAAEVELWLAGVLIQGSQDTVVGGFTRPERNELLGPDVHWLSDVFGPAPGTDGAPHGPVAYGPNLFSALLHADAGLSLCLSYGRTSIACKVYDYLGAGLPVVSEGGDPTDWDLTGTGAGWLVQPGNIDVMASAVRSCMGAPLDRKVLRERALRLGTWPASARLLVAYLRHGSDE